MPNLPPLADIANYHADAEAALRLLFSKSNPSYDVRFAAYMQSEVNAELINRLDETSLRSSLVILARTEAALRIDYRARCKLKKADDVSISFRKVFKARKEKARLDDDIIRIWYDNVIPQDRATLSQLRGMFKFRHWLAHGRYWVFGQRYAFSDVYFIADAVITGLPLYS